MIEKDNIQELFSKSLENHTAPVRPEVWNGLQAKMAAAGVSSVAATKGVSLLAKWIIGSAAVATTAVVTTVAVLNSKEEPQQPKAPTQEQPSTPAASDPSETNATIPLVLLENNMSSNPAVKPDGNQVYSMGGQVVLDSFNPFMPERIITQNELPVVAPTIVPKNATPAEVQVIGIPEVKEDNSANSETLENQVVKNDEAIIEFPNVFTPLNQDGNNDEYFIKCTNVASIHVIFQNTENRLVYETTDLNFKWNGRINGTEDLVEKGTYACIAVYQDLAGKTHKKIILIDVR
ncbi:MAG: gliding motility-associated C-terminal domain-containing protein [Flavobacteriia bacterium]|nr:gliding motility-associated C-terminal domain-containing protein [Flavobacteriia bacterium]